MLKMKVADLSKFFGKIAENETVYLPVDTKEGASYKKYEDGMVMSEAFNTTRSAKDFFFPQVENIADFKVEDKKIEILDTHEAVKDFVIFGVRACDYKSFEILDRVYLLQEPVDQLYKERRDHATIVTLACQKPQETCFCHVFDDIDAGNPGGDVTSWIFGDDIFFKANTEKGEKLIALVKDLLSEGDDKPVEDSKAAVKFMLDRLPIKDIKLSELKKKELLDKFNDPVWNELSEACLGCGTCTFNCPTCQCYDVREFNTGKEIKRFRCWDSCMYKDFTQMAAENSRHTHMQRFRQRFMHKLVYYPENNDGIFMCVGCGRCLRSCPIHMNIVKVAKALGGDK